MSPEDAAPPNTSRPSSSTRPFAAPIVLASVWQCDSPAQADELLAGRTEGYVYRRDGHPNADQLAERCRELHAAERAAITSSGMSALSLLFLATLEPGDHLVVSRFLYGRTSQLLTSEAARLGITSTVVDICHLEAVAAAIQAKTRLVVAETIANPLLQVVDIAALAEIAHRHGAKLLVDNTFASPILCQPLSLGADFVWESLTKIMNGHSDVVLGMLAGHARDWERIPLVLSAWGLAASPFDCWLALRGMATLHLRAAQASANALAVAEYLRGQPLIDEVWYPGLHQHPQHTLAANQFAERYGSMLAFRLRGGRAGAEDFIAAVQGRIPFCPSLGEVHTTLSHPESTSHRGLSPSERAALGIDGGLIRLSVGCEPVGEILSSLESGLKRPA